ncbi:MULTISPECIES: sortase-associated OmpA-like protein PdsO [unclassified Colwellia]|uniref:sortase-associated OmpA-like protein PdsO n=1 Tax=unclassified Colwellia TaxID=196834 RepID=UPI0015F63756|nr:MULTISPECIES: sortase-associated OmpA-like protein PdsO [unclassified Colwellia]MBA6257161.1 sortase-associated OmpA-like protein PdsO [Colwellia sp. MB3u-28]MBA6258746.1 sortase-associated OmpA-like protein PdsO [Colwellia sp. MB3u-41]
MKTINIKTTNNSKLSPAKLFLIASLIAAPTLSQSAYAFDNNTATDNESLQLTDSDKEGIGFGAGMFIGAIFGGPVGAILVGVTGSLVAKTANDKENLNELQASINKQESDYSIAVQQFRQKLARAEQNHQLELSVLEQNVDKKYQRASQLQAENLLMSLQFPTGSSDLQPHYHSQIVALSEMLQQSPTLFIDLSGYTDMQGNKKVNQALSIARVNTVKHALIDQGVKAERIQLFAFGEQAPVVANSEKEVSFYDRRVVIKLHSNSKQMANNY